MHCCTIYLGPNTHGTRGHLTSCHRGPMAGHAHSSKNAFFKTTRHLKFKNLKYLCEKVRGLLSLASLFL